MQYNSNPLAICSIWCKTRQIISFQVNHKHNNNNNNNESVHCEKVSLVNIIGLNSFLLLLKHVQFPMDFNIKCLSPHSFSTCNCNWTWCGRKFNTPTCYHRNQFAVKWRLCIMTALNRHWRSLATTNLVYI